MVGEIETPLAPHSVPNPVTVIGIDDTDSRREGMCTTYVADTVARRLEDRSATIDRVLLVRCNPAVEHKTRGNAALAIHTDAPAETAFATAFDVIDDIAVTNDERTNPGLVVTPGAPGEISDDVAAFARDAVRDHHARESARNLLDESGYQFHGWKNGRGLIGGLGAVGAWRAFDEWTYEHIVYGAQAVGDGSDRRLRERLRRRRRVLPGRVGYRRSGYRGGGLRAADAGAGPLWDPRRRSVGLPGRRRTDRQRADPLYADLRDEPGNRRPPPEEPFAKRATATPIG